MTALIAKPVEIAPPAVDSGAALTTGADCFHCAQPVPYVGQWPITFDGVTHQTCCAGCQAVASSILDAGLSQFYRQRPEAVRKQTAPLVDKARGAEQFAVYDSDAMLARYVRDETFEGNPASSLSIAVDGMHCGACVWLLESVLRSTPGVLGCSVSFVLERATVTFDKNRIAVSEILARFAQVGFKPLPFDPTVKSMTTDATRHELQRLFIAALAMMQVMMYAFPGYLSASGDLDTDFESLFRWGSLILTTPVVLYSAWPIWRAAIRDIRNRAPGMDVPVTIGILAAYFWSVWATISGGQHVYFDSVAMFVFLLLLARYVERHLRRRAGRALQQLAARSPNTVNQIVKGDSEDKRKVVAVDALKPGDLIEVGNGDVCPVDAIVMDAPIGIDESVLTGESVPRQALVGQPVASGAIIRGPLARLQVVKPAYASTLSGIANLISRGLSEKPSIVVTADRVARWFVSFVLILACVSALVWWGIDASRALLIAVTVLIVSCPCALSLATPAALAAATGGLLKRGTLVTRGHVLPAIAQVTDVILDKTGTLTQGVPRVSTVKVADGIQESEALSLAALLEAGTSHPLGQAIVQYAADIADNGWSIRERMHDVPGRGIAAIACNREGDAFEVKIGSASWCGIAPSAAERFRTGGVYSEVFLARKHASTGDHFEVMACFHLSDALREGAHQLIRGFEQSGVTVHLLSGDRDRVVSDCAARLGISHYSSEVHPTGKRAYVQALQRRNQRVLMIGDGLNDAPVLAQADVSVAFGSSTDLPRMAADTVVLSSDLRALRELQLAAIKTARIVRQNISWALIYNAVTLPMAVIGWIPPWVAALGMAASSLLVTLNAARLWAIGAGRGGRDASAVEQI